MTMKLKVQVTTLDQTVQTVTVDVVKLDVSVAVKKAVLALDLEMSDVYEAHIVTV
jgi:hypothetical protein